MEKKEKGERGEGSWLSRETSSVKCYTLRALPVAIYHDYTQLKVLWHLNSHRFRDES